MVTTTRKEIRGEEIEETYQILDQDVEDEERKRMVSLVVLEMAFRTHMQEERWRGEGVESQQLLHSEMKEEETNVVVEFEFKIREGGKV